MRLSFVQRLSLWLYGCLMSVCTVPLRWKLHHRGAKEPGYLLHREHRFGCYPGRPPSAGWVWVHAVSLGETRAAGILLRELRSRLPGIRVLLTHGTATGWADGQALLGPTDVQVWQPWDAPRIVRRFIHHFRPRMGIILETEVWPGWVDVCEREGVPLYLVNARLSEKSLRKAARLPWLSLPAYSRLTGVMAQTQSDANRLMQLGAPLQAVMGNLKFDVQANASLKALGASWRRACTKPVVLLASSRIGEELQFLRLVNTLGPPALQVQWLIVPRHPQRFDEVAALAQQQGWSVSKRSQWRRDQPPSGCEREMWIGDSLGEMQAYYGLATLAWLGGSFEPFGGQNLIEAAACGCPIVMGPHTFNFSQAAQEAMAHGAAVQVQSMRDAWTASLTWLEMPSSLHAARHAAHVWLSQSRGASRRCALALVSAMQPEVAHPV